MTVKHGHCACVLIPHFIKQALLTTTIVCASKKGETLLKIFPQECDFIMTHRQRGCMCLSLSTYRSFICLHWCILSHKRTPFFRSYIYPRDSITCPEVSLLWEMVLYTFPNTMYVRSCDHAQCLGKKKCPSFFKGTL